jgi:hypothetical protein
LKRMIHGVNDTREATRFEVTRRFARSVIRRRSRRRTATVAPQEAWPNRSS